ncbi:MAG TPA: hypothetical protein VK944_01560 [Candidatus Limnocylindria bacterium]|nr:hypothetical protein [Candidatus Limnocylindria bacterium]
MKRTILAGFMVFGLSVLIAGVGSVFAGETPVESRFPAHTDPAKHGVTMPGAASDIEITERFWSQSEAGVTAEYWGPVETGTLPGTDERSGLQDTGVDPSRWAAPIAE